MCQVKRAKKAAAKAKSAPELIALAKADDELAVAKQKLEKAVKEHQQVRLQVHMICAEHCVSRL